MMSIAIEMLLGDRVKYLMLIGALAFSTLLITQQTGVFWGVMRLTTTMLRNTNAQIWVSDPHVEEVNMTMPMRNIDLERVRSVSGVAWAVPLYHALLQAKLYNGKSLVVELVGVDTATLTGVPPKMVKGKLEDLWKDGGVIVDEIGLQRLSQSLNKPLDIGDIFDINDHEVRIVGIVKAEPSFFGYPFVYTTYDRAVEIVPQARRNLAYILVKPKENVNAEDLVKRIEKETQLRALSSENFFWSTMKWFFFNTGIPVSFGATIALGFLVGIAIAGQTFYSFINENLGNIGALKAMGASNKLLQRMLLLQASVAGFIGYGIGLFFAGIFGISTFFVRQIPFFVTWQVLLVSLFMIVIICLFTAYLGIRRVSKLEAAEVFRG